MNDPADFFLKHKDILPRAPQTLVPFIEAVAEDVTGKPNPIPKQLLERPTWFALHREFSQNYYTLWQHMISLKADTDSAMRLLNAVETTLEKTEIELVQRIASASSREVVYALVEAAKIFKFKDLLAAYEEADGSLSRFLRIYNDKAKTADRRDSPSSDGSTTEPATPDDGDCPCNCWDGSPRDPDTLDF